MAYTRRNKTRKSVPWKGWGKTRSSRKLKELVCIRNAEKNAF